MLKKIHVLSLLRYFSILACYFLLSTSWGQTSSGRMTMAFLPFEDRTNDPKMAHWRHSVPRMISYPLRPIRQIRMVEADATEYGLRVRKRKTGDAIDAADARAIGELIEASRVVWGYYRHDGKAWVATAQIMHVAEGTASPPITATSADWQTLSLQIAEQIVAQLNIVPTAEQKEQMQHRITSSAAALESYCLCYAFQAERKPLADVLAMGKRAIEQDPDFAEAYAACGATMFTQGLHEEAARFVEKARVLNPKLDHVHLMLGVLALINNNMEEGLKRIRHAVELNPDDSECRLRIGEILLLRGEAERALEELQMALQLNPVSAPSHAVISRIYATMGKKDLALRSMERAMAIDDTSVNVLQMGCLIYDKLGQTLEAISYRERFISTARALGLDEKMIAPFEARKNELGASLHLKYLVAPEPKAFSQEELQRLLREKLNEKELALVTDPLASTPAMQQWADEITRDAKDDLAKARAIYQTLAIHFDVGRGGALTAIEVFERWNKEGQSFMCQEYARLYVVLARLAGLKSYFTMVDRDHKNNAVLHACAAVYLDGKMLLVDPSYRWFGIPHQSFQVLNDFDAIVLQMNQLNDFDKINIAVKLKPADPLSLFNLAGQLVDRDRGAEAMDTLSAFLACKTGGWMDSFARGTIAEWEKRDEEAEAEWRKALESYSGEASLHYMLGRLLMRHERWAEARTQLRECLYSRPRENMANTCRHWIAIINGHLENAGDDGKLDPHEAWRARLLDNVSLEPPHLTWQPVFLGHLGLIFNHTPEALVQEIASVKKLAQQEPGQFSHPLRLAALLSGIQQDQQAEQFWQQAAESARLQWKRDGQDVSAGFTLVTCLRGNEEGGRLVSQLLKDHPQEWLAHLAAVQWSADVFMRHMCQGLLRLPDHGYDTDRMDEALQLRAVSKSECLRLLDEIRHIHDLCGKVLAVAPESGEALIRVIAYSEQMNWYHWRLASLCSAPYDVELFQETKRKSLLHAMELVADEPAHIAALALMLTSAQQQHLAVKYKGQVPEGEVNRIIPELVAPAMKRLQKLMRCEDAAIALTALEGHTALLFAQHSAGVSVTWEPLLQRQIEEAIQSHPQRILLYDLLIAYLMQQNNSQFWQRANEITTARLEAAPSARGHAMSAYFSPDPVTQLMHLDKACMLEPDNFSYALERIVTKLNMAKSDDALNAALTELQVIADRGYDLGYWAKNPEINQYRMRVFAVQQALLGKMETAEKVVDQMLQQQPNSKDLLSLRDLLQKSSE